MFAPITQTQKDSLINVGYAVEDMHKKWGEFYKGQFRWINTIFPDEFGTIQYSEDDAWADAHQYHAEVVARFGSIAAMYEEE